jgi:phosphatidylglycerol:prolipoprotein diacylglycerol transferase
MLSYPQIDPVAFSIGPVKVHWYGLMYLVGLAAAWGLAVLRSRRPGSSWSSHEISDLMFYIALGAVLGGRLGYVLFYDLPSYLREPLDVFKVWQGGMSFHGGLLGVIAAMWLFARRYRKSFFHVSDFTAPLIPIGLGAGRIGNFINGELWGRVTDVPWGMVFPDPRAGGLPRHPSQLYQAFLEGVVLFLILWIYSRKPRSTMAVSGMFLFWYGLFRFIVEEFREPDVQLGFLFSDWLTMGRLLSLPMIIIGMVLIGWAYRRNQR